MRKLILILLLSLPLINYSQNNENMNLSENLKLFENFIGKTFKGEFSNSTPENPIFDVQSWNKILNGNGIKVTHSVNNGVYGGESIIIWDSKSKNLVSWYFTTAGFYTRSTVSIKNDKITFHEKVTGNKEGITETKGIIQLLSNGDLKKETQYFQKGKWVKGHEIYYKETFDSKSIIENYPKVIGIGGIFFKTKNIEETKKWYEVNLGIVPTDTWGTIFQSRNIDNPNEMNSLVWSPFDQKTDYFDPSKKEFMINYRVNNIEKFVKILKKKEVTILNEITEYDGLGKFVHILDPEGNKIELWEPSINK